MGNVRTRLALTLAIALAAGVSAPAWAAAIFSAAVEKTRLDPVAFERQLRSEWAELGQEYASDLYACRKHRDLSAAWQAELDGVVEIDERSVRVDRFWGQSALIEKAPLGLLAAVLTRYSRAHQQLELPCAAHFASGGGAFRALALDLLSVLENPSHRAKLDAALRFGPWVPDFVIRGLIDLLPASLTQRFPWLTQPWFLTTALTFWRLPATQSSLKTLLALPSAELREVVLLSLDRISPTRISLSGLKENNQTYPFIGTLKQAWQTKWTQLIGCAGRWRMTPAPVDTLLKEGTEICGPHHGDVLKLLSIEDRMPFWFYPLSFKLALAERVAHEEVLAHDLNATLVAVENFTYGLRRTVVPMGLNHQVAPRLARKLLAEAGVANDSIRALVFMHGLGYQFFDIEAKMRLGSSSLVSALANAEQDLVFWSQPT